MDPNYGMYCKFQWKIRKNCMYSRKTLLSGVIIHSAELLMCSDILIVLIFVFYLIFRPYLYYATSRKIVSELYFEISFTHIYNIWSLIHNHLLLYCYGNQFYTTLIYLNIYVLLLLNSDIISKLIILTISILSMDGVLVNFIDNLWETTYICIYMYTYVSYHICTFCIYLHAIYSCIVCVFFIVRH